MFHFCESENDPWRPLVLLSTFSQRLRLSLVCDCVKHTFSVTTLTSNFVGTYINIRSEPLPVLCSYSTIGYVEFDFQLYYANSGGDVKQINVETY